MLNKRKGPAVWGLRAQIDRQLYKTHVQDLLFHRTPNLEVRVASVEDLLLEQPASNPPHPGTLHKCVGVILSEFFSLILLEIKVKFLKLLMKVIG